jgi:hypothetical protein
MPPSLPEIFDQDHHQLEETKSYLSPVSRLARYRGSPRYEPMRSPWDTPALNINILLATWRAGHRASKAALPLSAPGKSGPEQRGLNRGRPCGSRGAAGKPPITNSRLSVIVRALKPFFRPDEASPKRRWSIKTRPASRVFGGERWLLSQGFYPTHFATLDPTSRSSKPLPRFAESFWRSPCLSHRTASI